MHAELYTSELDDTTTHNKRFLPTGQLTTSITHIIIPYTDKYGNNSTGPEKNKK